MLSTEDSIMSAIEDSLWMLSTDDSIMSAIEDSSINAIC